MISKDEVSDLISKFFCESRDFNGIPLTQLCEMNCQECVGSELPVDLTDASTELLIALVNPCRANSPASEQLRTILAELVEEERISLVYDINPHIRRIRDRPKEEQKTILRDKFREMCAYPTKAEVLKRINVEEHRDTPYRKRMWECEANLEPVFFELEVLENYDNDARYIFRWNHISGSIHLSDAFYESMEVKPRDQTYLEHFGLGYRTSDGQRVVSVPLIYLSRLSPEHQQRWRTHEEPAPCVMDPDYYTTSIIGAWADEVPIYSAFLHELEIINQMCSAACLPPMFTQTFKDERPKYFRIPFRNTKEAFHRSVEEMDKLLSQNINKDFFRAVLRDDELRIETTDKKSGAKRVQDLGTLALLKHWIKSGFRFRNDGEQEKALAEMDALNKVRKIRQTPAHKIEKDEHGRSFADLHNSLLLEAYTGLRTIRLIFANHPHIKKEVEVPDWLLEGNIRLFTWKGRQE